MSPPFLTEEQSNRLLIWLLCGCVLLGVLGILLHEPSLLAALILPVGRLGFVAWDYTRRR